MKKFLVILLFISNALSAGNMGAFSHFIGSKLPYFWFGSNIVKNITYTHQDENCFEACTNSTLIAYVRKITQIPTINVYWNPLSSTDIHEEMLMGSDKNLIFHHKDYMKKIEKALQSEVPSIEEQKILKRFNAVVLHEAGHIKNKHMARYKKLSVMLDGLSLIATGLSQYYFSFKGSTCTTFATTQIVKHLILGSKKQSYEFEADDNLNDITSLKNLKKRFKEFDSYKPHLIERLLFNLFGRHPSVEKRVTRIDEKIQRLQQI